MEIQHWPVGKVLPYYRNPRVITEEAVAKCARSMAEFTVLQPLVVDEVGVLIVGHVRLRAAHRLGLAEMPVVVVHGWSEAKKAAYRIADNRVGEEAGWDATLLALEVGDLGEAERGVLGFDEGELDAILAEGVAGGEGAEDVAPPTVTHGPPVSMQGDVWILGRHRVLCGNATSTQRPGPLKVVLAGAEVDAVYADPPYGINLDTQFDRMHRGDGHRATGNRYAPVVGDDAPFDLSPWLRVLSKVKEQFWWGADFYRRHLPDGGSWVVWDKRDNPQGMALDALIGSAFELCWSRQAHKREIARFTWSGHHGMQGEDARVRLHPTQKPVALAEWFFERWVAPGGVVLDPYLGSGSTVIAAERSGRRCCGVEIVGSYVDVTVRRWQAFAGAEAVLEADGRPFDAVAAERTGEES